MTKGDVIISLYGLDLIDKYNINKVDVFTFSSDDENANLYLKDKKVYYLGSFKRIIVLNNRSQHSHK